MSFISLADLQYMSRETLAQKITSSADETLPANTTVIDVRDSDHIGGHIRGSTWVPSSSLDYKVPSLVRELRDKEVVVFHCALSQQRGPSAALRYLRERERLDPGRGEVREEGEGVEKSGEGEMGEKEGKAQRVYVLKGGFTEWQEKYGDSQPQKVTVKGGKAEVNFTFKAESARGTDALDVKLASDKSVTCPACETPSREKIVASAK